MAEPQPTPIHLAPAHRDIPPHRYVLHIHVQHCRCGALHEHSELYAKTHLRSRQGHTYFSNLRPITRPEEIAFNLPIDVVKLEPKRILFCSECISSASLAHLPPPPAPEPQTIIGGGKPDEKPKTKRDSKPFTIDDL
jgi:hypothetical protein